MVSTDLPIDLAAARGREEFNEGWGLDSCPYPDDGPMRTAWINAWCAAEEEKLDPHFRF